MKTNYTRIWAFYYNVLLEDLTFFFFFFSFTNTKILLVSNCLSPLFSCSLVKHHAHITSEETALQSRRATMLCCNINNYVCQMEMNSTGHSF